VTSAVTSSLGRGGGRTVVSARVPARVGRGTQVPPGVLGRGRQCGSNQARRGARFLIGLILAPLALGFSDSASFAGPPVSGPPPTPSPETAQVPAVSAGPPASPESRSVPTVALTTLIGGYRRFIGSQDIPSCCFAPSCSEFTQEALQRRGPLRGVLLGADRITRCHSLSSPQGPAAGTAPRTGGLIQDPVGWYLQPPPTTAPRCGRGRRVTAALLSAVLPGAGKAYCGRGADGLQSLLIVGTAALLAYRGFERDGRRSLEGWGGAGVGGVFYAGGIVGAAVSADLRLWQDPEKRPRVPAWDAGRETSRALDPRLGDAGIPPGDGLSATAMAGTDVSRSLGGSVLTPHSTDRPGAVHGISPGTAVLFSSLVPGSGQALAGSPGRGLNALVLNVALGAGVGVLARDGRLVESALLFSLGFLRYYQGNLYWAARLARERRGLADVRPGGEARTSSGLGSFPAPSPSPSREARRP